MVRNPPRRPEETDPHPGSEWGLFIDEYLKQQECYTVTRYPIDQVLAAIETFATGSYSSLSPLILEQLISVLHYPEHIRLLLNITIAPAWWDLLDRVGESCPLLSRSFGHLMLQTYGLLLSIATLSHNKDLDDFIQTHATNLDDESGVLTSIELYIARILNPASSDEIDENYNHLAAKLGWTDKNDGRGHVFLTNMFNQEVKNTIYLLGHLNKSRRHFLQTYNRRPTIGWSIILSLMCLHLKVYSTRNQPEELLSGLSTRFRDLTYRYYLVSDPSQHRLITCLIDLTNNLSDIRNVPFNPAPDLEDAGEIATAIGQQYLAPVDNTNVRGTDLDDLCRMFVFADATICGIESYDCYPHVFQPALERLWYELDYLYTQTSSYEKLARYVILHFGLFERCIAADKLEVYEPAFSHMISLGLLRVKLIDLLGIVLIRLVMNLNPQAQETGVYALSLHEP
ncbi:hypothetical protein RhiJN_09459 [Ceratobasidium sp. AG-Ba]|nr:hypothetical protein RhiJN_09459 [Ceratobasidium sp. AG-Ba]QRW10253.1 hypothetical protein RhiLY_09252 [Ceratobasidium sp. AG-Ba]